MQSFASGEARISQHDPKAPGCIVLDHTLSGTDGLTTFEELKRKAYSHPVIFLSGTGDIPSSVRALKAGAVDFLVRHVEPDLLSAAIRRALKLDDRHRKASRNRQEAKRKISLLTRRDHEVLQGVISGKMNKQIAVEMKIPEKTVKVHRSAMLQKPEVRSIPELIELVQAADRPE